MSNVLNGVRTSFVLVQSVASRLFVVGVVLLLLSARDALAEADVRRLDTFAYTSNAEAAKGWKAQAGTPTARLGRHHSQGLLLPCLFAGGPDRLFWDHPVQVDLSVYNGFELDISCEHPAAIRAISVYLKSGKGWYLWTGKLSGPGRQIIPMMKNDFSTEGTPSGWNQIEAVRVSAWKGESLDAALILHALDARNNEIVVVQGTLSAPNETERTAAGRSVRRTSAWLQATGIPHDVLTDDQVIAQGLDRVRLLILPYNPTLPKKELEAIRRFIERGGRLLVFYSSDAALAELMHMKLGEYKSAKGIGQWSSFVFEDSEAWHVPAEIFQESWNIRSAQPADASAKIIARWKNVSGEWTPDAALTASPQGVWMSHILLDDDALAKQRMLLGLVAHYYPEVWARAAWLCLHRAGRIASANSLGESVEMILSASRDEVRWQAQVDVLVKQARQLFSRMLDRFEARDFAQVADDYVRLRDKLMDAYALVQTPKIPEFRGVWDHTGVGLYPGDWNKTCRLLAQQGITAIFPNIAWGGVAHYASRVLPRSATFERYGDQLEQCVKAARRYGLEVHPWIICWNLTGSPDDEVNRFRKEDRLLVTENGKTYPWLNPVHPANQELGRAVVREIVAGYDVDGIHLDYIRFPSSNVGLGTYTRGRFEKSLGRSIRQWPGDVLRNGSHARAFAEWRAGVITEYVREVQRTIRDVKPPVRLSAAVYGSYPECARTIAQDWGEWVKRRYVDFVAPMNYAQQGAEFRRLVANQVALSGARDRIYPGIGVTSTESQLTADRVIEQIDIAREAGCPGFMLFDLDPTLRDKILPLLSIGITRKQ